MKRTAIVLLALLLGLAAPAALAKDRALTLSIEGRASDVTVTVVQDGKTKQYEHTNAKKFKAIKLKVKKGAKIAILVRNWDKDDDPIECVMDLEGVGEVREEAAAYADRADCAATIP